MGAHVSTSDVLLSMYVHTYDIFYPVSGLPILLYQLSVHTLATGDLKNSKFHSIIQDTLS